MAASETLYDYNRRIIMAAMFPCPKCSRLVIPVAPECRAEHGPYVHDATERHECP